MSFFLPFTLPSCNKTKGFKQKDALTNKRDSSDIADSISAVNAFVVNEHGDTISNENENNLASSIAIRTDSNSISKSKSSKNDLFSNDNFITDFYNTLLYSDEYYTGVGAMIYEFHLFTFMSLCAPFFLCLTNIILLFRSDQKNPLKKIFILNIVGSALFLGFVIIPFQKILFGYGIAFILWIMNIFISRTSWKNFKMQIQDKDE